MVAHLPVWASTDLLGYLEGLDLIHRQAMTVDTVSISEACRLRTETCAAADCESQLPMTIRYFPGGPSEPIVQIMRASDICIHCATKMYIWGIELGAALK
jgi:hypothetical protein